MRKVAILAAVIALAACGQKADLQPAEGKSLPEPAYGEIERQDAAKLLELDPLAAPGRSVELRKRSEEREDDPFDLPPE